MAKIKVPEPYLKTPLEDQNNVEQFKRESNGVVGPLPEETRALDHDDINEASEQLAKSHGIYLEYNRAKTGREKDWMYMVRLTVPAGGAFNARQWQIVDEMATKYCDNNPHGTPSIRLTTRQNVQYHWLMKPQLINLVQDIAKTGFYTLNGCGDNTRNVMGCPLSRFSPIFDGHALAHKLGVYFRLPAEPHIKVFAVNPNDINDEGVGYQYGKQLLNRKFKIACSALMRDPQTGELRGDNCVELRTNDLAVAPVLNADKSGVDAYMIYIGGGQGEKNGKATFATLAKPFGVCTEADLMPTLKAIVDTHSDWGDRKNRHWARLKYVVNAQGIPWFQDEVKARGGSFEQPTPDFDPGPRELHHGWAELEAGPYAGKLGYGAYVECGRLVDTNEGDDPDHQSGNVTGNGQLRSMVTGVFETFPEVDVTITPNQDLFFANIEPDAKEDFEGKLSDYGYGKRKGKAYSTLRVLSGACVGLPTCRLSYTDSEQFEPELIDELEAMGYGDVHESIGITGCERQCFRPGTKSIGWVGQGPNLYALKLGGSEDGRHQGTWLVEGDKWYLRQVPREFVPKVCAALFDAWKEGRKENGTVEDLGAFLRRLGITKTLDILRDNPEFEVLFKKALPAPYVPDPGLS